MALKSGRSFEVFVKSKLSAGTHFSGRSQSKVVRWIAICCMLNVVPSQCNMFWGLSLSLRSNEQFKASHCPPPHQTCRRDSWIQLMDRNRGPYLWTCGALKRGVVPDRTRGSSTRGRCSTRGLSLRWALKKGVVPHWTRALSPHGALSAHDERGSVSRMREFFSFKVYMIFGKVNPSGFNYSPYYLIRQFDMGNSHI